MTQTEPLVEGAWVPQACTLPIVERPSRLAEFDELFTSAVRGVRRVDPSRVRLELRPDPGVAARAADLMVRESGCCSFLTFTLGATGGQLTLDVAVPVGHVDLLDALAARTRVGGPA